MSGTWLMPVFCVSVNFTFPLPDLSVHFEAGPALLPFYE